MSEPLSPGIKNLIDAAERKGITLDIRPIPGPARAATDLALALDVEPGRIVKAWPFMAIGPGISRSFASSAAGSRWK